MDAAVRFKLGEGGRDREIGETFEDKFLGLGKVLFVFRIFYGAVSEGGPAAVGAAVGVVQKDDLGNVMKAF